jgi:hypothetical protein
MASSVVNCSVTIGFYIVIINKNLKNFLPAIIKCDFCLFIDCRSSGINITNLPMKYMFILLFILMQVSAFSQGSSVVFNDITHNFGLIQEENGIVEHSFLFTNTGNSSLVITGVNASCGCTTSGYTNDTVPPGGTGFVKASFNPYNRPGSFKKSLNVTTNGEPNLVTLYIEGNVRPMPRSAAEVFPAKLGALRFRFFSFNMGMIKNNAPASKTFDVYNDSDLPVTFSNNVKKPDHITILFEPQILPPQTLGKIVVTYDPEKSDLGYTTENIVILTNEREPNQNKNMRVVATVEEYFPPMTAEELARAPRIRFDKTQHDFGSTKSGNSINATFTITNNGHEPLLIRSVRSHCECLAIELDRDSINRNEQAVIRARFNTEGRVGNQLVSITVFTNDPQEPMKVVRVRGRLN